MCCYCCLKKTHLLSSHSKLRTTTSIMYVKKF